MKIIHIFILFLASAMSTVGNEVEDFTLALQWPISFCNNVIQCYDPVPTKLFTVHGLWPKIHGIRCSQEKLDLHTRRPILKDLNDYWPNLKGRNEDFWEREWNDHGKYSGMKLFDYFAFTLELAKTYQFLHHFSQIGMTPDEHAKYRVKDFIGAITTETKTMPKLKCNQKDGDIQLLEIRICLFRNGTTTSCTFGVTGCGYDEQRPTRRTISFPSVASLPRKWYNYKQ